MSEGAAAGWYDDGTGTGTLRWWDGNAWTADTVTLPPPPPVAPALADPDSITGPAAESPAELLLEIANRRERLRLDSHTLTLTIEGFTEQAVKKNASPRVLPLTSIESVVYEPRYHLEDRFTPSRDRRPNGTPQPLAVPENTITRYTTSCAAPAAS